VRNRAIPHGSEPRVHQSSRGAWNAARAAARALRRSCVKTFLGHPSRSHAPSIAVDRRARPKNAPLRTKARRFGLPYSPCRSCRVSTGSITQPPSPCRLGLPASDRLSTTHLFLFPDFPPPAPFRGRHSACLAPLRRCHSRASRDDSHGEGKGPIRKMDSPRRLRPLGQGMTGGA
jgi:hypothetical protein